MIIQKLIGLFRDLKFPRKRVKEFLILTHLSDNKKYMLTWLFLNSKIYTCTFNHLNGYLHVILLASCTLDRKLPLLLLLLTWCINKIYPFIFTSPNPISLIKVLHCFLFLQIFVVLWLGLGLWLLWSLFLFVLVFLVQFSFASGSRHISNQIYKTVSNWIHYRYV